MSTQYEMLKARIESLREQLKVAEAELDTMQEGWWIVSQDERVLTEFNFVEFLGPDLNTRGREMDGRTLCVSGMRNFIVYHVARHQSTFRSK